jgi:glyoxylase-like metal-dependent hydrolase (beta-lactamase superfamily II)
VLIDTGEDITSKVYTEFLIDTVFPLTKTTSISKILLTHGHGDHQGGVLKILKELKKLGIIIPKIYKRQILDGNFPCGKYVCEDIQDGECFNCSDSDEAIVLKAIFTPGHTDDHVAFLLQVSIAFFLFFSFFSISFIYGICVALYHSFHFY